MRAPSQDARGVLPRPWEQARVRRPDVQLLFPRLFHMDLAASTVNTASVRSTCRQHMFHFRLSLSQQLLSETRYLQWHSFLSYRRFDTAWSEDWSRPQCIIYSFASALSGPSISRAEKPEDRRTPLCRRKRPPRTKAHLTRPGPAPLWKQGSNNMQRRKGGVRVREQRLRSAMESGKSGPAHGTKGRPVLQVEAPAPRASNFLKRPHIHHGVLPVSSSDTKQSESFCVAYRLCCHLGHGTRVE
jgi:hypothetical protein